MSRLNLSTTKSNFWFNEWVILILMCLIIALGEFVGMAQPLANVAQNIVQPVQKLSVYLLQTMASPFAYGHSLYKAQRRIQDLELRYAEASALLGSLDQLKAENQALRELIQVKQERTAPTQIAQPILSYSHPLISSGSNQGVQTGQLVLVANTLVGLVGDVSTAQSQVVLLTQEGGPTMLVRTESGVQGLLKGDGKNVLVSEIPVAADLKVGERVTTIGQAGIPRDVFIGRIARITKSPEASVQTAVIEQIVSFYEAAIVEIQ